MVEYCAFYGITNYLPLRQETKVYQRRKVTVTKPVFPGYVFAASLIFQRNIVIKSSSLVRIIEVDNQAHFVWELEQIKKALAVDPALGATAACTQGKLVRIIDGPFRGIEGIVASTRGETRVVLNVDMIGQGVPVVVQTELLEPIEE